MKAYNVTIEGWLNFESIIAAPSRGRAKGLNYRDAHDAGWDIKFTRFRAVRVPGFDDLAIKNGEGTLGWKDGSELWGCLKKSDDLVLSESPARTQD